MRRRSWGWLATGGLGGLLLWANWQEPNLHDYPMPVGVGALQVSGVQPGAQATALQTQLAKLPGITACTISADAHAVAFTYHPDVVTPTQVRQIVAHSFRVREYVAPPTPVVGPQCPVPQGYITALERLRFALNLRRFFITI
ncbi:hypothetical protein [Hymenobacter bucti]